MPIERTVQLPYSPEQLFNLVGDIASYPQFLPYCQGASILKQQGNQLEGSLRMAYKGLAYTFTTHNTNHPPEHIHMQLVTGPFKQLQGDWRFVSLPAGKCQVSLQLNIVFQPAILGVILKHKVEEMTDKMVEAFTQRAKVIYG